MISLTSSSLAISKVNEGSSAGISAEAIEPEPKSFLNHENTGNLLRNKTKAQKPSKEGGGLGRQGKQKDTGRKRKKTRGCVGPKEDERF